jgi:hypothetical protein
LRVCNRVAPNEGFDEAHMPKLHRDERLNALQYGLIMERRDECVLEAPPDVSLGHAA